MARPSLTFVLRRLLLALALRPSIAWDYAQNGHDWGHLGLCSGDSDKAQSPIDLPAGAAPGAGDGKKLYLKYPHLGRPLALYNNGNSIAFTVPELYRAGFGYASTKGELKTSSTAEAYRLWQVNFHSPSEHTVNGKHFPLEMQMMHQRVTGGEELAVISVFFTDSNEYDPFLGVILQAGLPTEKYAEVQINTRSPAPSDSDPDEGPHGGDVAFQTMLGGSGFVEYTGSLTTPPCESNVRYFIRKSPVQAASSQLDKFRAVLQTNGASGNFRAIPQFTILGPSSVKTVAAVVEMTGDSQATFSDTEAAAAAGASADAVSDRAMVLDNDDFTHLSADDSREMRAAKTNYQNANQNVAAAKSAVADNLRNKQQTDSLYANAPGMVAKIDLKWSVIDAENNYKGAKQRLNEAIASEDAAISEAAAAFKKEQERKKNLKEHNQKNADSDADAGAEASSKQGNVGVQSIESIMRGPTTGGSSGGLNYQPRVELPRGKAASPFTKPSDNAHVTVGGGVDKYRNLLPNLKQPDFPGATVPAAPTEVVSAAATAPVDEGRQMVMQLPININSVDQATLKADIVKAIADATGTDATRIHVPEVQQSPFQIVQSVAPPAASAFLAQVQPLSSQ